MNLLQLSDLAAELQLCDRLAGETAQRLQLPGIDYTRLVVEDAEGAESIAIRVDQRCPGVEPEMRFTHDHLPVGKPLVFRQIRNNQQVVATNRRRTYRAARLAIDFLGKAVFALEPFPFLGDEIDHRDWTIANLTGHFRYIVQVHLWRRANDTIAFESHQSVALVLGNWTFHGLTLAHSTADIRLPIGLSAHPPEQEADPI